LGIPAGAMFKTLIARGERQGVILALVPGDESLSLRKLAQAMGDKRAEMVDPSEISRLTGFIKGGVSPLGGRRSYPVYLDSSALQHSTICVSAGMRGLAILIAPSDLAKATKATVVDILE
ncbi:MAG: aminoacyl-tRNA deacylase, partial [Chloroflexota bacterium]